MHMVKAMHMVHGGKPYFSPHGPPFRQCVIWRPAVRNAFLRLPRSALTASPRVLEIAQGYAVRSISSAQCAMPATGNMRCFFLNRIAHSAWGETLLFPPWAPFSPVCYMGACGTQCTFFKLPRSPRRLRQRGGLNARCHSASQNIFCDVAAFAAIPSLGPCALGTHGLAPCVRVCTGICRPVLKRSGSTVTCQRVLPAESGDHGKWDLLLGGISRPKVPSSVSEGSPFSGDITIPPGGRQLWHRSVRLHGRPDR